MGNKIVIASWGDPSAWRKVKYFGEQTDKEPVESISSLKLISEMFSDIEKFYIFVQDSLAQNLRYTKTLSRVPKMKNYTLV
ncbi:hypothetical protein BFU36_00035 [Sulfolobus sp. A20]|uniref:TM1812 family CRISPR-associated protein n=1 Tax=Sulfolobus sp. B1 TaxID=2200888 RepID=UPI000845C3ED|nr:TM1812 family CRISPR-associated protein [Sulfolobus sp. B1]AOL15391.1 hypothetical protein BFU36_00035 [Sulfolobus sp. A20]TRM77716.1 hypothetical protein DJ532_03705 [Sulfolobus sp. A20-N-F8]TRM78984.1 hypothetical protein DJ528_03320 [Sulfolobus sp. B5]TRM81995.1 hypothetical protein DJ531_10110 [Sulfolobus sp. A20-N-F6]TRM83206.1 hypothetical protein DJ522_06560 [Sulfolobus sp. F3]TRM86676.1 hypothetical protein DJ529_10695 [Sulfolobus sp. C3]TRM92973.1 hypothetical protein DJ526_04915